MPEQLLPGAFRVFDTVENRYVNDDLYDGESPAYVLTHQGWIAVIGRTGGAKPTDSNRYRTERWTGIYDRDGKPVYVGDAVHFEKYDASVQFERIEYARSHPEATPEQINELIPHVVYHLIRGVKEGNGDFELFCLNKNDDLFMGYKHFRKYLRGFRVIGNVHEPFVDLAARVPEYRDYLAETVLDQNSPEALAAAAKAVSQ